jgi:hypothetical protein
MKPSSNEYQQLIRKAERLAYFGLFALFLAIGLLYFRVYDPTFSVFKENAKELVLSIDEDKIENGIHLSTGFIDGVGLMTVVNNCTNCHSSKLVIQNRMSADRWNATIKWMQETQNLWQLGDNQKVIVDYLVKNYPPMDTGRREGLRNITWYELKE